MFDSPHGLVTCHICSKPTPKNLASLQRAVFTEERWACRVCLKHRASLELKIEATKPVAYKPQPLSEEFLESYYSNI